ncbi:MAG: GDSL-type esterase/lipase family protein [Microbacterium sp.]
MLGDSLTHFGPWPELLPRLDVINFGVSGNTSAQVRDRVGPVLQCRPESVVLLVGTNDIGLDLATPSESAETIEEIVRTMTAKTRVVLTTVPPRQPEFAAPIMDLNSRLVRIAASSGATLLDLWSLLDDGTGTLPPRFTTDGLHLTHAGYEKWARGLSPLTPADQGRKP